MLAAVGWGLGFPKAGESLTCPPLLPSLGGFMSTAERVRLPDDCTVGYIVEGLLGARLLRSSLFHSHLENLQKLSPDTLLQQVGQLGPCRVHGRPCTGAVAPWLPPAEQGLKIGRAHV